MRPPHDFEAAPRTAALLLLHLLLLLLLLLPATTTKMPSLVPFPHPKDAVLLLPLLPTAAAGPATEGPTRPTEGATTEGALPVKRFLLRPPPEQQQRSREKKRGSGGRTSRSRSSMKTSREVIFLSAFFSFSSFLFSLANFFRSFFSFSKKKQKKTGYHSYLAWLIDLTAAASFFFIYCLTAILIFVVSSARAPDVCRLSGVNTKDCEATLRREREHRGL